MALPWLPFCCGLCAFCDHTGNFLPSTAVDSETYAEFDCLLELQGPTSGVYQEADRLQQLQQQQLQQQQQQQQQQQRSVDSEALQLNAFSSANVSAAEADVNPGFSQTSQDLAGKHFDRQDQKHTYMCCCVSWALDSTKRKDVCNQCQESLVVFQPCVEAIHVPLISLSTLFLLRSTLLSSNILYFHRCPRRLFSLLLMLAFMQGSKRQASRAAVRLRQTRLLTTLGTSSQLRPGTTQVNQKQPQFMALPQAQVECPYSLPVCLHTSPSSNNSSRPCQHSWSRAVCKTGSRPRLLVLPLGMPGHWGLQGRSRPTSRPWHLEARACLRYS